MKISPSLSFKSIEIFVINIITELFYCVVKFGEPQIYIQRGHAYRRRVHPVIFKKEVIVISVQVSPVAASSLMRLVSYNFSVDRFIYLDNISAISKEKIRIEQRIVESRIVDLFAGLGSLGIFRAVDFLYPSSSLYKKIEELLEKADKVLGEVKSESSYRNTIERILEGYDTKSFNLRNADRTSDNLFIKRRISHVVLFDRLYEMWHEVYSDYVELLKHREELRALRKMKTERVSEMIRAAWKNRDSNVGRSNTGSVTDPMLLSLPTPPTSVAAISSLKSGGAVIAIS